MQNNASRMYEVWRYEVRCLKVDGLLSEANVLQAIRKSLRGTARETLIPLGEEATSDSMIAKLDTSNIGRFHLRTPGPVPFGTCICSYVETILS